MKERFILGQEALNDQENYSSLSKMSVFKQRESPPQTPRISARILWPALGFPAIINSVQNQSRDSQGDATSCICVLLLCNSENLSPDQAAEFLRYVPWEKRGRRNIRYDKDGKGRFSKHDLKVLKVTLLKEHKNKLGQLVSFGANEKGENGITASLSKRVTDFYRSKEPGEKISPFEIRVERTKELKFLYEIRVSELATTKLDRGLYHFFWNNESTNEAVPSDEMTLLLQQFARKRLELPAPLGNIYWRQYKVHLLNEYKYEYGSMHKPYNATGQSLMMTEILHPVFIQTNSSPILRIGQLTDTHVDVRADVYDSNIIKSTDPIAHGIFKVVNFNRNFEKTYNKAKEQCDLLLLTGDLIDYGRGYWGLDSPGGNLTEEKLRNGLSEDTLYHPDRNWFLFYYLLASGTSYYRPVYTILGNHDYRLNPYPPFAIGAPSPGDVIYGIAEEHKVSPEEKKIREKVLRIAHGRGHEPVASYNDRQESKSREIIRAFKYKEYLPLLRRFWKIFDKNVLKLLVGGQTLDVKGLPSETSLESVTWYLLCINPFLDYQFSVPSGHKILMLDWAEDENLAFPDYSGGFRKKGFLNFSYDEGPKARNCMTDVQVALVKKFTEMAGTAKIIGIHAPPIAPWFDWYDSELKDGWKKYDPKGRGCMLYTKEFEGATVKGHPLFAIKPTKGFSDPIEGSAIYGMEANYGSFEKHRAWFISQVANQKYNIRLVLSGHNHRACLVVTYLAGKSLGQVVAGEMLIKSVSTNMTLGVRRPAGALLNVQGSSGKSELVPGPLYVNGTSVGPLGHSYLNKGEELHMPPAFTYIELANDGTINIVLFKSLQSSS